MRKFLLVFISISFAVVVTAQKNIAPKPLFDDPVYHGAADPTIIYNKQKKEWWMFYTNRRASFNDTTGVKWVHGTRIGIAASKDGANWHYVDTANINYYPEVKSS